MDYLTKRGIIFKFIQFMSISISNPVLPGHWADPYVLQDGEDYYLYPTRDSSDWGHARFHGFHSNNLQNWSEPQVVLDLAGLSWAKARAWAPCVVRFRGFYWMYFCAENQIGLACSESPLGPFHDVLGRALIGLDEYNCQSIDPDIFIENGQPHLLWGQGKLWIAALEQDMHTFKGAPICLSDHLYAQRGQDPGQFDISLYNEGAHLQKICNRYLLTWTSYDTTDVRYQVCYAWADDVFGPYLMPPNNVIIEPTEKVVGTGHGSLTSYQNQWYLFYHRMGHTRLGTGDREVCCDQLEFLNGNLVRIVPTE